MSSSIIKYGSYDVEAAEEEQEELEKSKGGGKFFTPKPGRNVLRFLPPVLGRNRPYVKTWQHYFSVAGRDVSFNCPQMMHKKSCPVCKKSEMLRNSGKKKEQDQGWELKAKLRVFYPIIDRNDEEGGVKILGVGKGIHSDLTDLRADEEAGGDFTNPTEHGFDVIIARKGTDKNSTKYKVTAARGTKPLCELDEQAAAWIENQPNLEALAEVPSLDEIKRMLTGDEEEDDSTDYNEGYGGKSASASSAQSDLDDWDDE